MMKLLNAVNTIFSSWHINIFDMNFSYISEVCWMSEHNCFRFQVERILLGLLPSFHAKLLRTLHRVAKWIWFDMENIRSDPPVSHNFLKLPVTNLLTETSKKKFPFHFAHRILHRCFAFCSTHSTLINFYCHSPSFISFCMPVRSFSHGPEIALAKPEGLNLYKWPPILWCCCSPPFSSEIFSFDINLCHHSKCAKKYFQDLRNEISNFLSRRLTTYDTTVGNGGRWWCFQ